MTAAATATRRRFGSVCPYGDRWQARYRRGGRSASRVWPTERQAWAWLEEQRAELEVPVVRWPGDTLRAMPGFSTVGHLAELLGLSRPAVSKALDRGLTFEQSDRYAYALGYHPTEVWGLDWQAADP